MAVPLLFLKPFIFGRVRNAAAYTEHLRWLRKATTDRPASLSDRSEWHNFTARVIAGEKKNIYIYILGLITTKCRY